MKRLTRFFAAALIISGFTLAPVADSVVLHWRQ
jgi:hypothetical protein